MQTVKHDNDYKNAHWLLNDIERMYACVSDATYTKFSSGLIPRKFDESFKPLAEILCWYGNVDIPDTEFESREMHQITTPKFSDKNVLVCFSGGKDSFSVAKHYKDLGYNVMLYHIQGLNYAYCGKSSEHTYAEECAEYLGLPIHIDHVSYTGYHKWVEHPMKNYIMMNMALTYSLSTGFTDKIAVGTFQTASVTDNAFEVCGGDCTEMWDAYKTIVHRFLPTFDILIPNSNYETAFRTLQQIPDAIPHTISCVTSNRFRHKLREKVEREYNIHLFSGRCGVCWKCAVEYIWCADHDIVEYNEDYYIKCIMCLYNTVLKEEGYRERNAMSIWSKYFFYPIEESKAKERLLYAIISNGEVKSARKVFKTEIPSTTI